MPKRKPNIIKVKRKESTYNKILKRFTAINNKLPEDQKISLQRRRQIIKQDILPSFKDVPKRKILVRDINSLINLQVSSQPHRDPASCNLLYMDVSNYAAIGWWELDDYLSKVFPDCIYVQVSAGKFGSTKIFNTRNYNYYVYGVRDIVEQIRQEVDGQSIGAIFTGYVKLRKGKKNNGEADSYYLDLILVLDDIHLKPKPTKLDTRGLKLPKAKYNKRRVNTSIEKQIKKLKLEKDRKKRANKKLKKEIELKKNYKNTLSFIEQSFKKGYITKKKYLELKKELKKGK